MTTNGGEERTPKKRCVRGFQSRSEAFDACVLWVRERGGEVGPIVLREGEGGDCGVFTSSAKINKVTTSLLVQPYSDSARGTSL